MLKAHHQTLRTTSLPQFPRQASKESSSANLRPDWYRVQMNTVVRQGKDLNTERIKILPMGSRVRVLEICNRRVRIDKPVPGWCSLKSAQGEFILKPMDDDDEDLSTPRYGLNASERTASLREKIARVKEEQRIAKAKIEKARQLPEVQSLTNRHSKLTKLIRNKVLSPKSPRSMKAKLLHTQSCMSKLEFENAEKKSEVMDLQSQLGDLTDQISAVCRKQGVDNPLELTEQLERMESDQNEAKEKIQEYQSVTKRYEQEIVTMKEKMANLLNKSDPGLRRNSHRIDNIELHNPDPDSRIEFQLFTAEGDVVMMKDNIGIVIVHFIGKVHWNKDEIFVGVELGEASGDCNGTIEGQTYFNVKPRYGAFYPISRVERKIQAASLLKQLQKQVELNSQLLHATE